MKLDMFLKKVEFGRLPFFKRKKADFKYLKDPLFLTTLILYFLNRWMLKPLMVGKIDFFHSYFNDLICIPFLLPIVLFLTRAVRLRSHDKPPDFYELSFYLLVWSFCFEFVGPSYGERYANPVADPWDIACYAIGCFVAGIYWNFEIKKPLSKNNQDFLTA